MSSGMNFGNWWSGTSSPIWITPGSAADHQPSSYNRPHHRQGQGGRAHATRGAEFTPRLLAGPSNPLSDPWILGPAASPAQSWSPVTWSLDSGTSAPLAPGASAIRRALAACMPAPSQKVHAGERAPGGPSLAARGTLPKAALEQSHMLGNWPQLEQRHPTACKAKTQTAPKHKTPSQMLSVRKSPPVSPPPHPPGNTRTSGSSSSHFHPRPNSPSHMKAASLCLSAPKNRADITDTFHPSQNPGQEIKL